jgi:hypothetical protein
MSTLTFDTHKFIKRLELAGMPAVQAEAVAEAQREAFAQALETSLATKWDLQLLEKALHSETERLDRRLIEHAGRLNLLQWMIGFNLAFTMAVLWKVFS